MTESDKPLPRPPATPFGRKKSFGGEAGEGPLMADEMAAAAAAGRLDEYLEREMPDNEYAKSLAIMMMGMTGMLPPEGLPAAPPEREPAEEANRPENIPRAGGQAAERPPEEVLRAVESGDVKGLMALLQKEHRKRSGVEDVPEEGPVEETAPSGGLSEAEQETLDDLLKIASENRLSLDWITLRALKLYVEEYRRSGRL